MPDDFATDDEALASWDGELDSEDALDMLPVRKRLRTKTPDMCRALRCRGRTALRAKRMGLQPGVFKRMRKFGLPLVVFNLFFHLEQAFPNTLEDPSVRSKRMRCAMADSNHARC